MTEQEQMNFVESQCLIWDYYKPRHTHTWNMLILAANHLYATGDTEDFGTEYAWENLIIRLAIYRNTVKTLTQLNSVKEQATNIIRIFDSVFEQNGKNTLLALRNMIEHFDEYAAGKGHGPVERADLDPWRTISVKEFNRGNFNLNFEQSMNSATLLRNQAKCVSDKFIEWYKQESEWYKENHG